MIPKIIHQIWFQDVSKINFNNSIIQNYQMILKSNVPNELKNDIFRLLAKNPDYKYFYWNKNIIEIFLKKYYPHYFLIYNSLNHMIQKIDLSKYIIIYHYGGFFVDIDVYAIKSLNTAHFLKKGLYVSKTPQLNYLEKNIIKKFCDFKTDNHFINNGIIISDKNHPFFIDLIKDIQFNLKQNKEDDILFNRKIFNTTGPAVFTNSVIKYIKKNKVNNITILDNKYFEPCYGKDLSCIFDKDTILFHKHKSLWIKNIDTNNYTQKFILNNFFNLFIDSVSFYYFVFLRGYKVLITLIIIYYYIKYNKHL